MNKLAVFLRETSLGRFLIPLGIILLVFSVFTFKAVDHTKGFTRTSAVVTRTELYEEAYTDSNNNHYDATYTVYVKYTVDGKQYEEEYGIFSGIKEGDKTTICYNPNDPTEIAQPNSILLPICMAAAGVIALIGGVISLIRAYNRRKALKIQEEGWTHGN